MPKKVCVIIKKSTHRNPHGMPASSASSLPQDRRWEEGDCHAPRPTMVSADTYIPLPEHERLSLVDFDTFDNVSQTFFITVPTLLDSVLQLLRPIINAENLPKAQIESLKSAAVTLKQCGEQLKSQHLSCMRMLANLDAWKSYQLIKYNLSIRRQIEIGVATLFSASGRLEREQAKSALHNEHEKLQQNLDGWLDAMTAYRTKELQASYVEIEKMIWEFRKLNAQAVDFERVLSEHAERSNWLRDERLLLHPASEFCSYQNVELALRDAQVKLDQAAEKFVFLPQAKFLIQSLRMKVDRFWVSLIQKSTRSTHTAEAYLDDTEQSEMQNLRADVENLFSTEGKLKQEWKNYYRTQSSQILMRMQLLEAQKQTILGPRTVSTVERNAQTTFDLYGRSVAAYEMSRMQFLQKYEIPLYISGEQTLVQSIIDRHSTTGRGKCESFVDFLEFFQTQIKIVGAESHASAAAGSDWQYFVWSQYLFPDELIQNLQNLSPLVSTISVLLSQILSNLRGRPALSSPATPLGLKLSAFTSALKLDALASTLKLDGGLSMVKSGLKSTTSTLGHGLSVAQRACFGAPVHAPTENLQELELSQFTDNVSMLIEKVFNAFVEYAPAVTELTAADSEADKARFHTFVLAEPHQDPNSNLQIAITARNYVDSSFLPLCLGYLNYCWKLSAGNIAVVCVDQTQPEDVITANFERAITIDSQLTQIIFIVDQIHYMGACIRKFRGSDEMYLSLVNSATSSIVGPMYLALQSFCAKRGILFTKPVRFRQYGANCAFYTLEAIAYLSRPDLAHASEIVADTTGFTLIRLAQYLDQISGTTQVQTVFSKRTEQPRTSTQPPAVSGFEDLARKATAVAKFQRVSHFGLRQRWGQFAKLALADQTFTKRTEIGQRLSAVIASVELLPDIDRLVSKEDWEPACFRLV